MRRDLGAGPGLGLCIRPEMRGRVGFGIRLGFGLAALALAACANVKPYERGKLADPIMNLDKGMNKLTAEQKLISTREAGVGGSTGVGGGCGCAK